MDKELKEHSTQLANQAIQYHRNGEFIKAIGIYQRILNLYPFHEQILLYLSEALIHMDCAGVAANILENILSKNPKNIEALTALGVAFRRENHNELANAAWLKALEYPEGQVMSVYSNLSSLYADAGEPDIALKWIKKAVGVPGDETQLNSALWHKALCLLTQGKFEEGFKLYEKRQNLSNWDARKTIEAPLWSGYSKPSNLYIHGEQGVGDEIMFASALPYVADTLEESTFVTLEVNKKVKSIMKYNYPHWDIIESAPTVPAQYEAKIPIGSLQNMLYGDKARAASQRYLSVDPNLIKHYRKKIEELGPPPYVVVCWIGGSKFTRIESRSFPLSTIKSILDQYTCISGQYEFNNPQTAVDRQFYGLEKVDDASCGEDLHAQAALFKAADLVLTCQQTAVHVAGAVGANCSALIPHNPHWRYGQTGKRLPWYPETLELVRKPKDKTWEQFVTDNLGYIEKRINHVNKY